MSSKGKGKGNKKKGGAAKRGGAAAASNAPQQQQPEVTFEEALDAVEMMLEQSDLHSAEEALRHPALLGSLKPSDIQPVHAHLVPAMEIKAQVLIGRQQTKLAFQPDGGSEKWMYYGQLIGGREALQAFKQGIACMMKTCQTITEKQAAAASRDPNAFSMGELESPATLQLQLNGIKKQISSGYTSMAELYVTDLCDEPGAESDCEKLLALALTSCEDNPDALYALANLRTIQGRPEEAREVMMKLFAAIESCRASSIENMSILSLADGQTNAALPATISLADVSYELRVASAKLALELHAFEPALGLLEQLLEEDDRILEVSHLAAVCAFHCNQPVAAMEHIERAESFLAIEEDPSSGHDGMMDGDEEVTDAAGRALEQEEIDVTKRALAELKVQVAEAIKNAPPEEDQKQEMDDDAEMED